MIVKSMTFEGDLVPHPATVTVTMTVAEAAAITRVFGMLNGYAYSRLGLSKDQGTDDSIYYALTGTVFNPFWDGGIDELLPRNLDIKTLNDEQT